MPCDNIDDLPVELLLNVFSHLDSNAPSERKRREEPSLDLIKSPDHSLKNVSCVSKRWRRVILPLLFKYACLRLDVPWQETWSACPACRNVEAPHWNENDPALRQVEKYHVDMTKVARHRIAASSPRKREHEKATSEWAWRFYHVLEDFCDYLKSSHLGPAIRSLVVITGCTISGSLGKLAALSGHTAVEWRQPASAMFWQHLLSRIQLQRVVIVAPPTEMVCLTNASSRIWTPNQMFDDMDLHLLELQCSSGAPSKTLRRVQQYAQVLWFATAFPAFADASLLNLQAWSHLHLNEGSFLRGYGSPQYFDHGPPHDVCSIKPCLDNWLLSSSIRAATYIAIFPFSHHVQFIHWTTCLEELDVQFAPDPKSSILDDKDRIGTAELADCWQELEAAYTGIAMHISTSQMSRARYPRLKKVTCRDFQIPALHDELDEIFTLCCLPVWVEWTRGVYTRAAMSPHREYIDNE